MALTNPKIKDVFQAYIHEDVVYCETDDFVGGIRDIQYCFQPFIEYLPVPSAANTNIKAGEIKTVTCKENYGFKSIKHLVDTAQLTGNFASGGAVQDTSELTAYLIGTRAELIGLSRKLRERPFTIIVTDNNGRRFLIGTLQSAAYLKDFEIETGKEFDDDCGAEVVFRSNTLFYEFTGDVPSTDPVHVGDFDSDFDEDFD